MDMFTELIKKNTDESNEEFVIFATGKDLCKFLNDDGDTLLHIAAANNNVVICDYLCAHIHVNMGNYAGTPPLYFAASNFAIDTVKLLINNNANPKIRGGRGLKYPIEVVSKTSKIGRAIVRILETRDQFMVPLDDFSRIKLGVSKYVAYKYRLYMSWLSNLNYFNSRYAVSKVLTSSHRNSSEIREITKILPDAVTLFESGGIKAITTKCQQLLYEYSILLGGNAVCDVMERQCCLNCGKVSDLFADVKPCEKCRKVFHCNYFCQNITNNLHKLDC